MKTLVLVALMSGIALAAKPVFQVPETGGFDHAFVTLGVTNDSDAPMKLEKGLCDGLAVADKDGKALAMKGCDDLAGITIGAGETVTRRFNLTTCFPDLAATGNFTVTWAHPLFKDAGLKPAPIEIVAEYAEFEIDGYGTVVMRFWGDKMPKTVANFKKLVTSGFYNSLTFHRIIRGFMMQGGDPKGDGTGGPGWNVDDEKSPIPHTAGIVSMAKTAAPNSAGSQFFICFAPAPNLDGGYASFGKVIEGMDVVWKVEHECRVPDQRSGKPVTPPVIKKATWHEKK